MTQLALTDDELAVLRDVLSAAYRDLRMEVVGTDNVAYRHGLQAREATLKSVLDRLGGLVEMR